MKNIFFASLFIVIILTYIGAYYKNAKARVPVKEINDARKSLHNANMINATRYAPKEYGLGKNLFDSAMFCWQYENNKFFYFRNYDKVRELAIEANNNLRSSIAKSEVNSTDTKNKVYARINNFEIRLTHFEQTIGRIPGDQNQRILWGSCQLLLQEAGLACNYANFHLADQKLDSLSVIFSNLRFSYYTVVSQYFRDYDKWQNLLINTVNYSKDNHVVCLVIDKFAHKLYVYSNGIPVDSFSIELGQNWLGDKNYQGDKSTPEGEYHIVSKRNSYQTRYYKALLINYPNEDDKQRFHTNKLNQIIHRDAKIGNLIEIHGMGGKGIDWTEGCIALKNKDMDAIFDYCTTGTKIAIIGSILPLERISEYEN